MSEYNKKFFAPKVIPCDSTGRRGIVYRIWYWNPHGKSCFMRGCYTTEVSAQKKLDALKMKMEGKIS